MNKQEATKMIAEMTAKAKQLVRDAEKLANEHELEFSFSIAYGMGGYYTGHDADWEPSDEYADDSGWSPSSQSC